MTLCRTVHEGDRIASLEALRDTLAAAIDSEFSPDCGDCRRPHAQVAALSKQLGDVMREIDALRPRQEANIVDEIGAKRSERRADAAVPKRAVGTHKRRT